MAAPPPLYPLTLAHPLGVPKYWVGQSGKGGGDRRSKSAFVFFRPIDFVG